MSKPLNEQVIVITGASAQPVAYRQRLRGWRTPPEGGVRPNRAVARGTHAELKRERQPRHSVVFSNQHNA